MAIERVGVPGKRAAVFLFFLSSVVMAASSLSLGQVAPRWEVFGGYAYRSVDSTTFGFVNRSNLNGFDAEGTFNITPRWGVTADVGGQYGSQMTVYNFLIGPQYALRRDKSKFFVHGLFGKAQDRVNITTSISSHFESVGRAIGAGGGYDLDLTPRFTFRVQADFLRTDTFRTTQNDIRASTGLVFHFGHIGRRPKL
jgi:Outer membrane protein beta-barrel domain